MKITHQSRKGGLLLFTHQLSTLISVEVKPGTHGYTSIDYSDEKLRKVISLYM